MSNYQIEMVAGEDRHVPMTFLSRNPDSGHMEPTNVFGNRFVLVLNGQDGEVEQLDSANGTIKLGNLRDGEFVEATEGEEEVTAIKPIFDHNLTNRLAGRRVKFFLYAIGADTGDRQCVLAGGVNIKKVIYE